MSNADKPENDFAAGDAEARRKHRLARLALLRVFANDPATPAPDKPEALSAIATPPIGLEAALRENKLRKLEAKKYAAAMAPELEKQIALRARLDALPQRERRQVLDAIGQNHISAVPPPMTPLRGSGSYRPPPRAQLAQVVTPEPDTKPHADTESAPAGTATVWTPERKAEARAMLNKLRVDGVRDFARRTAASFHVSPARLRVVLREKTPKKPAKKAGLWGE